MYDEDAKKPELKMSYEKYSDLDEPMKVRSAYAIMNETGVDKVTLMSAIQDTTANAEKLVQMTMELLQHLEPIRHNEETMKEAAMDEAVMARVRPEYGSPVAEQISRINDILRRTQSMIARAMDDIDL